MASCVAERSGLLLARGVGAAILLAPSIGRCDPALFERSPPSTAIFSSFEADRDKSYGALGIKQGLGGAGLDASGFRLGLKWGQSAEPAQRRPTAGRLLKTEAHAMLGYEWRLGDSFLAVSAGPELEAAYRESRNRSSLSQRIGPRLQLDLWAKPSENLLVQASAYAAGNDGRLWARLAPGWKLAEELYLGPEIEGYRERDYHKLRLGLHLTGLRFLGLDWRVSAGAQRSGDRRAEAYATLGILWQR